MPAVRCGFRPRPGTHAACAGCCRTTLRRIVKVQASKFVPCSKRVRLRQARKRVSWTRSSAAIGSRVSETANRCRAGTTPTSSLLNSTSARSPAAPKATSSLASSSAKRCVALRSARPGRKRPPVGSQGVSGPRPRERARIDPASCRRIPEAHSPPCSSWNPRPSARHRPRSIRLLNRPPTYPHRMARPVPPPARI